MNRQDAEGAEECNIAAADKYPLLPSFSLFLGVLGVYPTGSRWRVYGGSILPLLELSLQLFHFLLPLF
jgi:hypothetical protein